MVKYGQKNGKCVTVKAEDRPSGSAGDSASVSTPLFRISVELSLRGVCLSRASEAPLSYQDCDIILWTLFLTGKLKYTNGLGCDL